MNTFGRQGLDLNTSIMIHTRDVIELVYSVSLHMKSAKAIRSKREIIEEQLVRLGDDKDFTFSACKELLKSTRSILDTNGSYCCRCNKALDRKNIKECNGCHRMTYCSRVCQKEDWLNGHKLSCCKTYRSVLVGQFQGRMLPEEVPLDEREAAKLEKLEINITQIQLKLFLDNADEILRQASSLGIPLYDCIVRFHLPEYPPTIEVIKSTWYFKTTKEKEEFEDSRAKENITCVYHINLNNGQMAESGLAQQLVLQKLFPHKWLSEKTQVVHAPPPRVVNSNQFTLKRRVAKVSSRWR